jgi:hypothetical protein
LDHQEVRPEVAGTSIRRGQDQAVRIPSNDSSARDEAQNLSSIRNTRPPVEDVRESSGRPRTRNPRDETVRRSRGSNLSETEQQKFGGSRSDRSSRVHLDPKPMSKEQSRVQVDRDTDSQASPVPRQETTLKAHIDSSTPSTESIQLHRTGSAGSNQGRSSIDNRPRTPEGPRGNDNSQTNSPNVRGSGSRDMAPPRPMRYDPSRPNNPPSRPVQGFRAPPPTGPRASTVPSMHAPTSNVTVPRSQVSGRTASTTDSLRASAGASGSMSTPPAERSDLGSSARTTAPGMNPDRAAMIGLSSHESDALTRSDPSHDSRSSRNRITSVEGSERNPRGENVHPNDAPRGPSDWKGREKRDIQDEDPRRLSRGPDTWDHFSSESERQGRPSDETGRSVASRSLETQKESSISKFRLAHDRDIRERDDVNRTSLQSRGEQARKDVPDTRRTRANFTSDRESDVRSLRSSAHGAHSDIVKAAGTSEGKTDVGIGKENDDYIHNSTGKDTTAKRTPQAVTSSREQKEIPRDGKATNHRADDDSQRRREERESIRSRKDESTDSRHDRSKDGHHVRASARRSPSRSNSDRGEKKDRERESDRRNGSRKEARESDSRDKDRPLRELEHRRDGRDRERSNRDRETESRRGSRKHERDRSAEALDRGIRSGEAGQSLITGDSTLPSKRRRVVR